MAEENMWWQGAARKDPVLRERIRQAKELRAASQQPPTALLIDPIENDPEIAKLLDIETEKAKLAYPPRLMRGYGHILGAMIKSAMKENHGVTWYTKKEMNPGAIFD